MKNKKLLYGVLFAGALVGLYLWDKKRKSGTCTTCSQVNPQTKPTSDTYANAGGGSYGLGCKVCERPNGTTYFARFGGCSSGDKCITSVRPTKAF